MRCCLRAWTHFMSTSMAFATRPNSRARRMSCHRCADSSSDLEGMHPRRMQSPPTCAPPSITAARAPRLDAVRAAAKPALPPPMTATSNSGAAGLKLAQSLATGSPLAGRGNGVGMAKDPVEGLDRNAAQHGARAAEFGIKITIGGQPLAGHQPGLVKSALLQATQALVQKESSQAPAAVFI